MTHSKRTWKIPQCLCSIPGVQETECTMRLTQPFSQRLLKLRTCSQPLPTYPTNRDAGLQVEHWWEQQGYGTAIASHLWYCGALDLLSLWVYVFFMCFDYSLGLPYKLANLPVVSQRWPWARSRIRTWGPSGVPPSPSSWRFWAGLPWRPWDWR